MPKQRYCAKATFDSPSYSQGVKVSGSGTFLFISGQIPFDPQTGAMTGAEFFRRDRIQRKRQKTGGRGNAVTAHNHGAVMQR